MAEEAPPVNGLGIALSLLLLLGLVLAVESTRRLLVLDATAGRVVRMRGRGPSDLVSDLEDVVARSRASGRIVLRLESGRVAVHASGSFDEGTKQQLRNVVGRFPVARLRTARRVTRG